MAKPEFDETFDFVIVGSGAGSMCAALMMRSQGKSVLILEKTEYVGGTTSQSGGAMWIPNNRFMKAAGDKEGPELAMAYLDALADDEKSSPGNSRARRLAYVQEAPKMLDFLIQQGVRFRRVPSWPDYFDEPGASATSRMVTSELFDMNKLGPFKDKMRPAFVPYPVTTDEVMQLPWIKVSKTAKKVAGRMAFRMFLAKLRKQKLTTAGGALQGQVIYAAMKAGTDIRLNSAVRELLVDGNRVVGVDVETDGVKKRIGANLGVLLNAGGFARNQAMRDQYLPDTRVEWTKMTEGDTGEMIQEAVRIGAWVAQMGNLGCLPVALPPGMPPAPMSNDMARPHAIFVDQRGERFANESDSYMGHVNGMLRRHKTAPAIPSWMIVDQQYVNKYMLCGTLPGSAKPQAWYDSGFLRKGETIEELAKACDLPPEGLKATVERFNGFVRKGRDDDFHRGETHFSRWTGDPTLEGVSKVLGTLEQGPFYAIAIYPGDVGTNGGLVTDEYARVVRKDGTPIEGLYATGTTTANVMGSRNPGAGVNVGPGFVFGYVAAKHAANAGNVVGAS